MKKKVLTCLSIILLCLAISNSKVKADEEIFLDNIELNQLEELMRIKIIPCLNEGKDFVDKILK